MSSTQRFAGGRPEHRSTAPEFYEGEEVSRYSRCSQTVLIQRELTLRALELLELKAFCRDNPLLLDVGCGSGLSGRVLSERGMTWLGTDISMSMLTHLAVNERQEGSSTLECGYALSDAGQGLPFRENVFSHAISISAVQWLCYRSGDDMEVNRKALRLLFADLRRVLVVHGRAVLQLYIEGRSTDG
uniref:Methyltransferase type 11 domain-containing protein n=1 Tax=Tetraselmis chuii TaxID=63592 RepID=A0A7S1X296_9CHLO|mmetsp:Transcript_23301/g.41385  ORF Transcript_23301/g.41385 Transcript_23301/m.41385 type:complete len:187 (+) Transcript_23301:135-695(+)